MKLLLPISLLLSIVACGGKPQSPQAGGPTLASEVTSLQAKPSQAKPRENPCTDPVGLATLGAIETAVPYTDQNSSEETFKRATEGLKCTKEWLKTAKLEPEVRESYECWIAYDEKHIPDAYADMHRPEEEKETETEKNFRLAKQYEREHPIPKPQCVHTPQEEEK